MLQIKATLDNTSSQREEFRFCGFGLGGNGSAMEFDFITSLAINENQNSFVFKLRLKRTAIRPLVRDSPFTIDENTIILSPQ